MASRCSPLTTTAYHHQLCSNITLSSATVSRHERTTESCWTVTANTGGGPATNSTSLSPICSSLSGTSTTPSPSPSKTARPFTPTSSSFRTKPRPEPLGDEFYTLLDQRRERRKIEIRACWKSTKLSYGSPLKGGDDNDDILEACYHFSREWTIDAFSRHFWLFRDTYVFLPPSLSPALSTCRQQVPTSPNTTTPPTPRWDPLAQAETSILACYQSRRQGG